MEPRPLLSPMTSVDFVASIQHNERKYYQKTFPWASGIGEESRKREKQSALSQTRAELEQLVTFLRTMRRTLTHTRLALLHLQNISHHFLIWSSEQSCVLGKMDFLTFSFGKFWTQREVVLITWKSISWISQYDHLVRHLPFFYSSI